MRKKWYAFSLLAIGVATTAYAQVQPFDNRTLLEKSKVLTPIQYMNAKADAIGKLGAKPRKNIGEYDVEILSTKKIIGENGIPATQIRARAWYADGMQVGFGPDGTVDIETFNYYNPRVFVPDVAGEYARNGKRGNSIVVERFREDPQQAMYDALAYTLRVKKEKFDNRRIQQGKVGTTTSTFYPDANPESTSGDSGLQYTNASATWAAVHDQTTGSNAYESNATFSIESQSATCTDWQIQRGLFVFDTSSIPDTDSASSVTLGVYVATGNISNGDNDAQDYIAVYESNHTATTSFSTSDFDYTKFGTTVWSDTKDLTSDFTLDAYNTFTLTAAGIADLSVTSVTRYSMREGHDAENVSYTCGGGNTTNRIILNSADTASTTTDPILTVEHSAAAAGGGSKPKKGFGRSFGFIPKAYAQDLSADDAKAIADFLKASDAQFGMLELAQLLCMVVLSISCLWYVLWRSDNLPGKSSNKTKNSVGSIESIGKDIFSMKMAIDGMTEELHKTTVNTDLATKAHSIIVQTDQDGVPSLLSIPKVLRELSGTMKELSRVLTKIESHFHET